MADEKELLLPLSEQERKLLRTALKALGGAESGKLASDFSAENLANIHALASRVDALTVAG